MLKAFVPLMPHCMSQQGAEGKPGAEGVKRESQKSDRELWTARQEVVRLGTVRPTQEQSKETQK